MTIKEVLSDILKSYLNAKQSDFANNELANNIRTQYLTPFKQLLSIYGDRYIVKGSAGQGKWADCPWIAIFDSIITTSAYNGYYLVYLFDKEMKNVYLSLNQGVTVVKEEYRRNAKEVLNTRAENFRCKLDFTETDNNNLSLHSNLSNPKLYEHGNILSIQYATDNIPDDGILINDLNRFLRYYQELVLSDSSDLIANAKSVTEIKQRRLHEKFDRNGALALKVKQIKGYTCEACGFEFSDMYGELGHNFIEAHHLIPFSQLDEGRTKLSIDDFAVLCSNCHSMIHKQSDPSDLNALRSIIKSNRH